MLEAMDQAHEELKKEKSLDLSEVLMADFLMHLATTTLMLLLRENISRAKTPQEIADLKSIPDQIITGWEQSRRSNVFTQEQYLKMVSEIPDSDSLTPEGWANRAKKFSEDENNVITDIVANLRKAFTMIKESL